MIILHILFFIALLVAGVSPLIALFLFIIVCVTD